MHSACAMYIGVDFVFQVVAVPNRFCSVCGMTGTANAQDPKVIEGPDTGQTQSFTETENTVENKGSGLLPLSSVEDQGSSDSPDAQSKGPCSAESPVICSAVISADECPEQTPDSTEGETLAGTERQQCDHYEPRSADEQIVTGSEQPVKELLDVAQQSVANDSEYLQCNNESDSTNTEGVTVSEELSTQEEVTDVTPVVDETATEQCVVSDGCLGELLSCAECGSSGLYFVLISCVSFVAKSPNLHFPKLFLWFF